MRHCIKLEKFNREMLRYFTVLLGWKTVRVAERPSSSCMKATTSIPTTWIGVAPRARTEPPQSRRFRSPSLGLSESSKHKDHSLDELFSDIINVSAQLVGDFGMTRQMLDRLRCVLTAGRATPCDM